MLTRSTAKTVPAPDLTLIGIKTVSGQRQFIAILAGLLLALSILLGGAAPPRPLFSSLLQLIGLITLSVAVLQISTTDSWRRHRLPLGLAAAVIAVPLIQLLPLPPELWMRIPGREQAALAPALAGVTQGWTPISLSPDKTWSTALGLIPALGLFLACLTLDTKHRLALVAILLVGVVVSVLVGALQLANNGGVFNLHHNTPDGMISGFFVNRNHLASFLLLSLPFAAALAIPSPCWSVSAHALSWFTGLFGLLVVVALGAVLSRAGIILLAPAMLLGLAIILKSGDFGRSVRAVRIWLLGGLIAIAGVLALGLSPIVARFSTDGSEDRFDRWPGVLDAAGQYQPIGAGLGSFDTVYRAFEPVEWLDPTYFNHAHNDYLELWLETGWLGAAVFLSVMFWTGSRWLSAWRGGEDSKSDHLARAAGGALLLLAMHSVVDFPLRTTTVMVVAALCFGLIAAGTAERPRPGAAIVKA